MPHREHQLPMYPTKPNSFSHIQVDPTRSFSSVIRQRVSVSFAVTTSFEPSKLIFVGSSSLGRYEGAARLAMLAVTELWSWCLPSSFRRSWKQRFGHWIYSSSHQKFPRRHSRHFTLLHHPRRHESANIHVRQYLETLLFPSNTYFQVFCFPTSRTLCTMRTCPPNKKRLSNARFFFFPVP